MSITHIIGLYNPSIAEKSEPNAKTNIIIEIIKKLEKVKRTKKFFKFINNSL